MALTLTQIFRGKFEDKFITGYTCVFDSSYAAGGETVTPNLVGMTAIDVVIPMASIGGVTPVWDSTASKLRSFVNGSTAAVTGSTSAGPVMAESTAGTDLSTVSFPIVVIGI